MTTLVTESRKYVLKTSGAIGYSNGEHWVTESGSPVEMELVLTPSDVLPSTPTAAFWSIYEASSGALLEGPNEVTPLTQPIEFMVTGLVNTGTKERKLLVKVEVEFGEVVESLYQTVFVRKAFQPPGTPVTTDQVVLRLSGGSANNNGAASLGGLKSQFAASGQLFGTLGSSSSARVIYRCVYVQNDGASSLTSATVSIQSNTPSPDTQLAIGLGTSPIGGVEQTVGSAVTAPTGVTFSEPDELSPLAIGTIPAGQAKAVWIRLSVDADAVSFPNDGAMLSVGGNFG